MNTNVESSFKLFKQWSEEVLHFLPKMFLALLVLAIFYFFAKISRKFSQRFYSRVFKKNQDVAQFISIVVYALLIASGIFLALEIMGLDSFLTKLLAGAGIVGIVAGFAFKDVASNAFAGLLVNMQHPFKEGDWVSLNDNFGIVTDVGWITTTIKTIPGQEVFIPNQLIYSNSFTNFSTFGKRRIIFKSGVSYGDDLDLVKRSALEEVKGVPHLLENEPVEFFFTEIGSYSYNFDLRFWIKFDKQTDYMEAMSEIVMRIKKRFEKEDISLAYAVTTLDFGVKGGVNIFDKPIDIKK